MTESVAPFRLLVAMYHYVRDAGDAAQAGSGIPGLPLAQFEAQLDWLAGAYDMIPWPVLRDGLLSGHLPASNACLLSFDDGVIDHYVNVFPALRRRGLSGLFFALARPPAAGLALGHKLHFLLARLGLDQLRIAVLQRLAADQHTRFHQAEADCRARHPVASVDADLDCFKTVLQRDLEALADPLLSALFEQHVGPETAVAGRFYLSPSQVVEMRAGGMHFGGHSRSHPWLDAVSATRQAAEIAASAEWLGQVEPGPWAFAYPYGGFTAALSGPLKAHGFVASFTTQAHTCHTDPFFIGRLDGEDFSAWGESAGAIEKCGEAGS
jgi:peptidoglycan/xylan/chitin deacetylase (PgdA/CDA1 family)